MPLVGSKTDPAVLTEAASQKGDQQVAAVSSNDREIVGGREATDLPDDPDVQYCDKGSDSPAIAACDRAIYSGKFRDAVLAILHNDRGYLYMIGGDLGRGRADFDRAIEIDPDGYHPYWNRAEIFRKQGDKERALADYAKALSLNPKVDDRPKIEASLQALGGESAAQEHDPTVITTPTWGDPGEANTAAEASVPSSSYPAAAMPASPPLAVTPALPAAPAPMPAR